VHVTLRLRPEVGSIRNRRGFALVRQVMGHVAGRGEEFRIVHLSIQGNHVHLLCEAAHRVALTRGVQAFKIAFAKRLNKQIGHRGAVFEDRYHDEVLVTPTQVRRCIGYVLCNWRKHGFDAGAAMVLDPYSTARHFTGWVEQRRLGAVPRADEDVLPRVEPRTWLLRDGWRRGGSAPSVFEVPGRR
jgi:REP element-mobilizing transposase RayT